MFRDIENSVTEMDAFRQHLNTHGALHSNTTTPGYLLTYLLIASTKWPILVLSGTLNLYSVNHALMIHEPQ